MPQIACQDEQQGYSLSLLVPCPSLQGVEVDWAVNTQLIILKTYCIMQAQKSFQTATVLFYENKLEQALLAINQSIRIKPSSVAFGNRALVHFHMGKEAQAREDIAMALSINPLNYAAYLNLSSIDARQQDTGSAIENLTCGISALRLIYGRRARQRSEVIASLQSCHNNFDALILLILMDAAEGNFKEALRTITKYQRYQDDKPMARKVREKVEQLTQRYSCECEQRLYELLEREEVKQGRLQCSTKAKTRFLEEEMGPALAEKVKQFNKYYQLVNNSIGKINLVPKPSENYVLMQQPEPSKSTSFLHGSNVKEMIASH